MDNYAIVSSLRNVDYSDRPAVDSNSLTLASILQTRPIFNVLLIIIPKVEIRLVGCWKVLRLLNILHICIERYPSLFRDRIVICLHLVEGIACEILLPRKTRLNGMLEIR